MAAICLRLPLLLAGLWWGGLTALSLVAVPLAFLHFGSPAVAGPYAARLFQIQCWASLLVSMLLVLWLKSRQDKALLQALLPWLLLAALASLLQEFGVAQRILSARAAGGDLRLWHSLGTLLVLLQWLAALRTNWVLASRPD
jgi:Domain of unknown function (DUF4149)